jgi:sigma-E factor negative regulatory protein RseB
LTPRRHARSSERFAWGLLGLLVSACAIAGDEPRQWLERMNDALTSRNYDVVFSHWQGGKVEMLRIIHRVRNGEVSERLVSLDGSGREFIRTGTELACYLPDKRTVLVERRPEQSPLLGNFPKFDEASTAFYDIQEVKRMRFLSRPTRVIAVNPKDEFRYGYRLWIDEGTSMPLKTQLCDSSGKVIEQLVFANPPVTVTTRIPDSAFKPEVSTEGFQWLRNEPGPRHEMVANAPAGTEESLWSARRLPPGFSMTVRGAQVMPGSSDPVTHLVFSDGVVSVSVFVESQPSSQSGESSSQPPAPGVARVGSSSAFSTVIEGHKVTAVGEVPPETVKFIANSVKSAPLSLQSPPRR